MSELIEFSHLIGEIYDADEPRFARGCPAQAWSVAEVERVKKVYGWSDSDSKKSRARAMPVS
jgi:glycogen debranching enzyme